MHNHPDDSVNRPDTYSTQTPGLQGQHIAKPDTICGDLRNLPTALASLIALPHWVLWRWEKTEKGKWTKVPYQPRGHKARNNDPKTWTSYDAVLNALPAFDGIGFCLFNSEIVAFDIDDCRDPITGVIDPWAFELVERVGSYTEITVSGTGLRIIGLGTRPKLHRKLPVANGVTVEMYRGAERYIVITGNPLNGSNAIVNIDEHLDATVAELEAKKTPQPNTPERFDTNSRAAIDVNAMPVSDRMKNLIRGINDPEHMYQSRSEAVFAVVMAMINAKCPDHQIQGVMFDKGLPIGAHVREQPNPVDYLVRQIRHALAKIGGPGAVVREIKIKARMEDVLKSARELQTKTFEALRWTVPKYLPEGLTLLDGRPKIGKSWQALDISVGVSSGGMCLGEQCEQGDVLALMLEDSDRRLQRRLTQMLGAQKEEWPARLKYATSWPRLNEGGLDWIREWVSRTPKGRLVVIDILERIRQLADGKDRRTAYSADYDALIKLHELATEAMIAILVLHHQRKLGADDLIDTLSGTLGLGGAVDSVLILGKAPKTSSKFVWGRGRDLEEFSVTVNQNDKGRWDVIGEHIEEQPSVERANIILALSSSQEPMSIADIAKACHSNYDNVKVLLWKLKAEGFVETVRRKFYKLADPQNEMPF